MILTAEQHLKGLLSVVFEHTDKETAVIVYDTDCLLSTVLAEGYKRSLPHAILVDFNEQTPEAVLETLGKLEAYDLAILVQSTSFRLDAFRIRVELFKRKIKVIEHPHLSRMTDEEAAYYIDALAYDADYTRGTGRALKSKIDAASSGVVNSDGEQLFYDSPFAKIFCFGDIDYKINRPETPITLIVKEGQVVDCENSTPAFDNILSNIRRDEGTVWIRELGFGLNRAFSTTRTVADTGSYERMCGVHVSLGAKHGMYGKPGFKRRDGMYHVDVFIDTDTVTLGEEVVYRDGAWIV